MPEEMARDIARCAAPRCRRCPPPRWVRRPRGDVAGDPRAREAPHFDAGAVPQVREHAPRGVVEPRAEAAGRRVGEGAPSVVGVAAHALGAEDVGGEACCRGLRCGVVVAVDGFVERARPVGAACVQRVLVVRLVVHAFDDVDFSVVRPALAYRPPRERLVDGDRSVMRRGTHQAGQTPQPVGMALKSAMKRPEL